MTSPYKEGIDSPIVCPLYISLTTMLLLEYGSAELSRVENVGGLRTKVEVQLVMQKRLEIGSLTLR